MLEVASARSWLTRLLDTPVPRAVGRVSYGMYLLHFPLIEAAFPVLRRLPIRSEVVHFAVSAMACVLVTFLLASLMHYVWERPFLRLRDRF